MMQFGPVGSPVHGGHGVARFDLAIGLAVLALTWVSYFKERNRLEISLWAAIGVTAICAVFIYSGISGLFR
jgi:hypothetical protein